MQHRPPALFRQVWIVKLRLSRLGLPMDHPATRETLSSRERAPPLGRAALALPRGSTSRLFATRERECARLARWLARHGPLDLCVLGSRRNGHLLMNEPADVLDAGPHVARLAATTRATRWCRP